MVFAGLQTKENCETNNKSLVDLANAFENKPGVGSGSITFKCCNWSCCNYNTSAMSLTEAPVTSTAQLKGEGKFWLLRQSRLQRAQFLTSIVALLY